MFAANDPDAWVTTKVKMALLTADNVDSMDVHVDTMNGLVTLYGKASSADERSRVERAARTVEGVRDVRNLIQVVPNAARKEVASTDDQIKDQVEKALDQKLGSGNDIDVQNVTKGVVLLSGDARTLTEHYRAMAVASRVPGVHSVKSEIKSPESLADREIWYDDKGGEADKELSSENQPFRDGYITSAVKIKLMAEPDAPAVGVNVDTDDGVVTLFGMAPTQAAKQKAGEIAQATRWVRKVDNELQVVPPAQEEQVEERDDVIAQRVNDALKTREGLRESDIQVEVSNRVARLSGEVPSLAARYNALVTARTAKGVKAVVNDLKVVEATPAVGAGPAASSSTTSSSLEGDGG
jgi:hyperosmotically inducible protein